MIRRLMPVMAATALAAGAAFAQVPQYGPNVTLEQAKKVVAAAEAEARKNNFAMAIAVVDTAGLLVHYSRMDNSHTASVQISQDKAVSAAWYRRPTKAFQEELQRGGDGLRILTFPRANGAEGGVLLMMDGKIIGGVGASGGSAPQDGQVATAGANALK